MSKRSEEFYLEFLVNLKKIGEVDIENMIKCHDIHGEIVTLLGKEEYDSTEISTMKYIIHILQWIFNNTSIDLEATVPNDLFDRLYAQYNAITGEEIIGAGVVSDKDIKNHTYVNLRGTLEKVHYFKESDRKKGDQRKSLEKWFASVERTLSENGLSLHAMELQIYPKFDGMSIIIECDEDHISERMLTRGDTGANEAIDVTNTLGKVDFSHLNDYYIPDMTNTKIGIKTEVIMTKTDFEYVYENIRQFKSCRSAVTSIVNSDSPDEDLRKYITIIPLRVENGDTGEIFIPEYDYNICDRIVYDGNLDNVAELASNMYYSSISYIPVDGVVIHIANKEAHEILGRKNNINKFEVAFKFPADFKETTIEDVKFQIGELGTVTPVAIIDPVVIKGNTITNISLGSVEIFKSLNLCKGDTIKALYEIIPTFEFVRHNDGIEFTSPTTCPFCGHKLVPNPLLSCVNDKCPRIKQGRMRNYIKKMNIPFLSDATINKFMSNGIMNSIPDIYKLKEHMFEITELDGFGDKSYNKIIRGIDARREVYLYDFLGSIGIDSMGRTMFKNICMQLNVSSWNDAISHLMNRTELTKLEGVSTITANKIVDGLIKNEHIIREVLPELIIKPLVIENKNAPGVCFTEVRDKDIEAKLKSKGITIDNGIRKNTKVLVIKNEGATSSKIPKANKKGIPIITIDVFRQELDKIIGMIK